MTLVLAVAMTLGLAGMASAAAITCGDCHSTPPVNGDNCAGDADGLHGVHFNYSGSLMPKSAALTDKCAYCHTSTTSTAPTSTHNNNYINVTTTTAAPNLAWDSGATTCTGACHSGAPAGWGNYTSPSELLACNSCHDDTTAAEAGTATLSGAHNAHMGTAISVAALNNNSDADCAACHPDNTADQWSQGIAEDGSVKAYPHASDGTNVVEDNASLNAGVSATRGAGATDTCAGACHSNLTNDQWGAAALQCASCHNTTADAATNTAANVTLDGGHNTHFTAGKTCTDCHPNNTDTSHVVSLPVTFWNGSTANPNVTVNAALGWNGKTCSNTGVGCHGNPSTTPVWGTSNNGCTTCHEYPDGANWTGTNGHTVQYDLTVVTNTHLGLATDYNKLTDTYATVTADSSKCGKCHSGGTHNNGTIDIAGNGNNYCGTGNFTPNVNTSGSDITCSNVSCHSGKTTPNWW